MKYRLFDVVFVLTAFGLLATLLVWPMSYYRHISVDRDLDDSMVELVSVRGRAVVLFGPRSSDRLFGSFRDQILSRSTILPIRVGAHTLEKSRRTAGGRVTTYVFSYWLVALVLFPVPLLWVRMWLKDRVESLQGAR